MTSQNNVAHAQVQRVANDITARLTQLLKEPPDLTSYLRAHADCLVQALAPVGLSYEMISGNGLKRVLVSNIESLGYRQSPEQEVSFQKAAALALKRGRPVVIAPNVAPAEGLHGLQPEDSPAPDELPLYNRTPYEQFLVPIQLAGSPAGILHIWFQAPDGNGTQIRQALLTHACGEIELYLKSRRLGDVSQELTRLNTYSHLLQELAGDLDLESVTWNIVNYARESLACERVCLFVATDYGRTTRSREVVRLDYEYELFACSGLKKPHPRSEHAVILKGMARKLTEMALARTAPHPAPPLGTGENAKPAPGPSSRINGASAEAVAASGSNRVDTTSAPPPKPSSESTPAAAQKAPATTRPQIQLMLVQRDPSKTSTRPEEVNDYFEVLPMNWATVLPLFDRHNGVCGIVLFEGVKQPEKLESSFLHMRDLAVSAGRSLGTALKWNKQRSLRTAQKWISFRQTLVDTPLKRWITKVVLPVGLVVAILMFPVTYNVKGHANVIPARQNTLPMLSPATLLNVAVQEGELVKKDQVLATFDTAELQLQLRQAMDEYRRALVESDAARNLGNEAQMQMARLSAAKWQAQAEKFERYIRSATIRAPFDGMVLGAQSLSNRIGQYLREGEPVMAIADPHHWQVKVMLTEQDITYLHRHMPKNESVPAELKLAADPTKAYPLEITKPSQLAYGLDTAEGKYFFGVVLPLDLGVAQSSLVKSGFSGRVSFAVNQRPLGYVLFRDFFNFIRYRFL
jgi:hypothetical protein